jgi:hypothetical protein
MDTDTALYTYECNIAHATAGASAVQPYRNVPHDNVPIRDVSKCRIPGKERGYRGTRTNF